MREFCERISPSARVVIAVIIWATLLTLKSFGETNQIPPIPTPADRQTLSNIFVQARLVNVPAKTNVALLIAMTSTNRQTITWDAAPLIGGITNVGFRIRWTDGTVAEWSAIVQTNGVTITGLALRTQYFVSVTSLDAYYASAPDGKSGKVVTNETDRGVCSFILPLNEPILSVSGGKAKVQFSSGDKPNWLYAGPVIPRLFLVSQGQSSAVTTYNDTSTNGMNFFKLRPQPN